MPFPQATSQQAAASAAAGQQRQRQQQQQALAAAEEQQVARLGSEEAAPAWRAELDSLEGALKEKTHELHRMASRAHTHTQRSLDSLARPG